MFQNGTSSNLLSTQVQKDTGIVYVSSVCSIPVDVCYIVVNNNSSIFQISTCHLASSVVMDHQSVPAPSHGVDDAHDLLVLLVLLVLETTIIKEMNK